jgi:hypothetical protein
LSSRSRGLWRSGQLTAFVEQFVNLTGRRLAAVLADRPPQGGQQPRFRFDDVAVADVVEA